MNLQESVDSVLHGVDPASAEYKGLVASLMNKIDPTKPLGTALHSASVRLNGGIAFEAACLRLSRENGKIEVYLRQRAENEDAHPGQWHLPGTFVRQGEQVEVSAWRLGKGEFKSLITNFRHVGDFKTPDDRGEIESKLFRVWLEGEPQIDERHKWFSYDQLPDKMVDFHAGILIPAAVEFLRQGR